jgi:hypothetical protein
VLYCAGVDRYGATERGNMAVVAVAAEGYSYPPRVKRGKRRLCSMFKSAQYEYFEKFLTTC